MKGFLLTTCLCLMMLMSGCGGDGGTVVNAPTPMGTAVSLAKFRGYFMGYTTAGHPPMSFNLTGADTQGVSWSGTYTLAADGPSTMFENQTVSVSSVTMTANTPVSNISNIKYFLAANGNLYKITNPLGTLSYVPSTSTMFPSLTNVGDHGSLASLAGSDGSTVTITWELSPEFNGNSLLKILTVTTNSFNALTTNEVDTFYLDRGGNPYKLALSFTYGIAPSTSGITVTMVGKKN